MMTGVTTSNRTTVLWTLALIIACFGGTAPVLSDGIEPEFRMDSDPDLNYPEPVEDFDPAMAALWLQALNRPETDLQRMAAETIARGHQFGIPDLEPAVPRLEEILLAEASHPSARFAAASALIALDSRSSSDKLFEASQTYGADLRQLIEPVLATWENPSATAIWIERLADAETRARELVLAMRGLGVVGEQSALSPLLSIVGDARRNAGLRLEAAAAAGSIADSGLEETAREFAGDTRAALFVNQICAIRLLARHTSEAAQQLLSELAADEEPSIAVAALQRLNEIDVNLVLPLAESAIQNADPLVRRQGAICLLQIADVSHIASLSPLLADPHPGLRHHLCNALYELASNPDLNDAIRDGAMGVLAGDRWQGHQEASLLLGALEHQPAATRLVELLDSPRIEVRIPAAWALRKVAVPETVPGILVRTQKLTDQRNQTGPTPELETEVAHLFEAVGEIGAEEAVPQLLGYVPKRADSRTARGAAIWAIGRIYEGRLDRDIEQKMTDRILDFSPQPLEAPLVKQMSAIALGRMGAVDQASMMKQFAGGERSTTEATIRMMLAMGWAVRELTGEELPPPKPLTAGQGRWFLEPVNDR